MRKIRSVLIFVFIMIISACQSYTITYQSLGVLKKGTHIDDHKSNKEFVSGLHEDIFFISEAKLKADKMLQFTLSSGKPVRLLLYKFTHSPYESSKSFWIIGYTTEVMDYVALAFVDDELYFWGFVDDFKKTDDKVSNEIGTFFSQILIDINNENKYTK